VLRVREYPLARYEAQIIGTGPSYELRGELELLGQRRPLELRVETQGELLVAQVELVPSRWGIRQYTALLSTLRVADRVRVEARLRFE
jgi:polyisoprenoid-binding protein YceI